MKQVIVSAVLFMFAFATASVSINVRKMPALQAGVSNYKTHPSLTFRLTMR